MATACVRLIARHGSSKTKWLKDLPPHKRDRIEFERAMGYRQGFNHRNAPLLPVTAAVPKELKERPIALPTNSDPAKLSPRKQRRQQFWELNKNIIQHREKIEKSRREKAEVLGHSLLPNSSPQRHQRTLGKAPLFRLLNVPKTEKKMFCTWQSSFYSIGSSRCFLSPDLRFISTGLPCHFSGCQTLRTLSTVAGKPPSPRKSAKDIIKPSAKEIIKPSTVTKENSVPVGDNDGRRSDNKKKPDIEGPWRPTKKLARERMEELRQMHEKMPDRYPPQSLARIFGISPEAVKRILRSKWKGGNKEA